MRQTDVEIFHSCHWVHLFIWIIRASVVFGGESDSLSSPYDTKTVIFDKIDGTTCQPHEFIKVKGLNGFVYSHDPSKRTYRPQIKCFLSIEVPPGHRITLESLKFDLGYPEKSDKCLSDSLFIFDNQPENEKIFDSDPNMLGEFCGIANRSLLATSSKNSITLYWHAGASETRFPNAKGFVLKWSVLRILGADNEINTQSSCDPVTEFACSDNRYCIPMGIACDSVPHCIDGSDVYRERQLAAGCENVRTDSFLADLSGAAIACIIIACILIGVVTIVVLVCCCVRRGMRSSTLRNSLNYQPAPTRAPMNNTTMSSNITPTPASHNSSSDSYNNFITNKPNYNNHYHPRDANGMYTRPQQAPHIVHKGIV